MPRHMISMIRAELRAVLGRTSGKVALIFGLLIPLVVAVLLAWFQQKTVDARFNGMPISQLADLTIRGLAGYALMVRNMVVLPLLLVLATAASVAGERRDNTLREVAVRPVPRWSIVLAKAISLLALSAGTLVLTLVPSLGLGAALFESSGGIDRVLLGYLTCLGTDLGLICLAMLAGSFVRSVGGVVVLLVLLMLGDLAASVPQRCGSPGWTSHSRYSSTTSTASTASMARVSLSTCGASFGGELAKCARAVSSRSSHKVAMPSPMPMTSRLSQLPVRM